MNIFISWSGEQSRRVAYLLRDWLPQILGGAGVSVWHSSEDIPRGKEWLSELLRQLTTADAGIVCLTHENLIAPWVQFEVGALSARKIPMCPILVGEIRAKELPGCLGLFQKTELTENDLIALCQTLSRSSPRPLTPDQIARKVAAAWQKFQPLLDKAIRETDKQTQLAGELHKITANYRHALKRSNYIFHGAVESELFDLGLRARERAQGILDATVEHYNHIIVDIYQKAKTTVFSTSIPEYDTTWRTKLGQAILDAHAASTALVTRIFVFQNRDEIKDSHWAIMEQHQANPKVTVKVFLSAENAGVFEPDVSRDFTLIDGGDVIGLTHSYGLGKLSAKWHFGDTALAGRLLQMCERLERWSKPLEQLRR